MAEAEPAPSLPEHWSDEPELTEELMKPLIDRGFSRWFYLSRFEGDDVNQLTVERPLGRVAESTPSGTLFLEVNDRGERIAEVRGAAPGMYRLPSDMVSEDYWDAVETVYARKFGLTAREDR